MTRRKSTRRRYAGSSKNGAGAFLWVAAAVVVAILFIYWQNAGVVNKTPVLEKKIERTLKKFSIKDKDLAGQAIDKRRVSNKTYVHKEKVYNAANDLSLKQLERKLKSDLDKSEFKLAKSERLVTKDSESYHATINYGDYNVMDLKVVKPKGPPLLPVETKRFSNPKVAIVLDDFGYNTSNLAMLSEIKEPLTLSILPELRYSSEIASRAKAKGYEVILHLPLESERADVQEEFDTIRSGMGANAINSCIARELKTVPWADGVSNHMGSKSTSEHETMAPIFACLKKRGLYFFDSMTSPNSVCREVASEVGIRYARRDIFLDNSNNLDDIEAQIDVLKRMAFRKGRVVAVGHDRKNTIIALRRMIPELKKEGIEIVPLSEVVK